MGLHLKGDAYGTHGQSRCCPCCCPERHLFANGARRSAWKDWQFLVTIPAPTAKYNSDCHCTCNGFAGSYLLTRVNSSGNSQALGQPSCCCDQPTDNGGNANQSYRLHDDVSIADAFQCDVRYLQADGVTDYWRPCREDGILPSAGGPFPELTFSYNCMSGLTTVDIDFWFDANGSETCDAIPEGITLLGGPQGACFLQQSVTRFRQVFNGRFDAASCSGVADFLSGNSSDTCYWSAGQQVTWAKV